MTLHLQVRDTQGRWLTLNRRAVGLGASPLERILARAVLIDMRDRWASTLALDLPNPTFRIQEEA